MSSKSIQSKATKAKRFEVDCDFLTVQIDANGNILFGVKTDGTVVINEGNLSNNRFNKLVNMGQYYNPVILKENWKNEEQPVRASVKCYDFDNGAKLMEHSYVGNNFVKAVMLAIVKCDTDNKGVPFVWCGDCADEVNTNAYPIKENVITNEDGTTKVELEGGLQCYSAASRWFYKDYDSDDDEKSDEYKALLETIEQSELHNFRYIINRTKGLFVKVPAYKKEHWFIHPLPILTSSGSGRGGGDYSGEICKNPEEKNWQKREYEPSPNAKLVGSWAYDHISVTNDPVDCDGLTELEWYPEEEF
jgi:hypothetical protein